MAYIDCNDKTQRKAISDFVHDLCGLPYTRFEIDRDDLRKIEAVMERQEEIIEEQEERIAIMSEGGWIPVEKRLPEKGQVVLAYGKRSSSTGQFQGTTVNPTLWHWKGNVIRNVTHWMPLPEPPKDGDQ